MTCLTKRTIMKTDTVELTANASDIKNAVQVPQMQTDIEVMTEQQIRFNHMLEEVRKYHINQEWKYDENGRNDGGISFASQFKMSHGTQRFFMDVFGDGNRFAVFSYPCFEVPEEFWPAVAIYTTYVNYGRLIGKMELDMSDGEIRMSACVNVMDSHLSQDMISVMENLVIIDLDKHTPAIMKIIYGGLSPSAAYDYYTESQK